MSTGVWSVSLRPVGRRIAACSCVPSGSVKYVDDHVPPLTGAAACALAQATRTRIRVRTGSRRRMRAWNARMRRNLLYAAVLVRRRPRVNAAPARTRAPTPMAIHPRVLTDESSLCADGAGADFEAASVGWTAPFSIEP